MMLGTCRIPTQRLDMHWVSLLHELTVDVLWIWVSVNFAIRRAKVSFRCWIVFKLDVVLDAKSLVDVDIEFQDRIEGFL